MDKSIIYCKSWFWAKKRPTVLWTEKQAKQAHEKGLTYTVVVKSGVRLFAVIDVAKSTNFVGVVFLDDLLRSYLSYDFKLVETELLFLSMVTHCDFEGDKNQVKFGSSYIFHSDGRLIIRNQSFFPASIEEVNSSVDITNNYETYPNFGEYEHLFKIER